MLALPDGWVGATAERVQDVDARWLMAFAAAVGDTGPVHLDTTRPGGIAGHPLFPVAYEWPVVLALRDCLAPEVARQVVHASHDVRLRRLPRPGDRLRTMGVVSALRPHRAGTFAAVRVHTVDGAGETVSLTDYGSIFRDVACPSAVSRPADAGADDGAPPPSLPTGPAARSLAVPVAAGLAHVYSECARIWNPIHTDRAVARAAGLPDVILHGTATLALAVSALLRAEGVDDPARVRRIAVRFGAMVRLPSTLAVEHRGTLERPDGCWLAFRALTPEGEPALRDGWLRLTG
jgi:acyl dehydratase